jgi:thiol-disulfide isomerase/thioredoxin
MPRLFYALALTISLIPIFAHAAETADAAVKLQTLDYDGLQKLIATHKGKVVVMDAWATYCGPCVKEFPNLVALHKKRAADGLACISLSLDFDGTGKPDDVQPAVLAFLRKKDATMANVLSSLEADELCKKLEFAAPPAVFVYDRQGKLRKRFDAEASKKDGPFSYEKVEALVDELLKEKP